MSLGKFFGVNKFENEDEPKPDNHPFWDKPKVPAKEVQQNNLNDFKSKIDGKKKGLRTRIQTQSDQLTQFREQNESVFLGQIFDTLEGTRLGNQIILFLILFIKLFIKQDFKINTIGELEKGMEQFTRIDNPSVKSKVQAVLSYQNLAKSIETDADEIKVADQLIITYENNQKYLEQALNEINKLLNTQYLNPQQLEEELKKDFVIEIPKDYKMFDENYKNLIDQQLRAYQKYKSDEIEIYRKQYDSAKKALTTKRDEIIKQISSFIQAIVDLEKKKIELLQKNKVWVWTEAIDILKQNRDLKPEDRYKQTLDLMRQRGEFETKEKQNNSSKVIDLIKSSIKGIEKSKNGLRMSGKYQNTSKLFAIEKANIETKSDEFQQIILKLVLKLQEIEQIPARLTLYTSNINTNAKVTQYPKNIKWEKIRFMSIISQFETMTTLNAGILQDMLKKVAGLFPEDTKYAKRILNRIQNSVIFKLCNTSIEFLDSEIKRDGKLIVKFYDQLAPIVIINEDHWNLLQIGAQYIKINLCLHYYNDMAFIVFDFTEKIDLGSDKETNKLITYQEIVLLSTDELVELLKHNKLTAKALENEPKQ